MRATAAAPLHTRAMAQAYHRLSQMAAPRHPGPLLYQPLLLPGLLELAAAAAAVPRHPLLPQPARLLSPPPQALNWAGQPAGQQQQHQQAAATQQ